MNENTESTDSKSSEQTGHTPEPWHVRSNPVLGSFVEAPMPGKPYGQEILADDYEDATDNRKHADCERIVACVNACAGIQNPAAIKQLIEAARGLLKYGADNDFLLVEKALRALDSPVPKLENQPRK